MEIETEKTFNPLWVQRIKTGTERVTVRSSQTPKKYGGILNDNKYKIPFSPKADDQDGKEAK